MFHTVDIVKVLNKVVQKHPKFCESKIEFTRQEFDFVFDYVLFKKVETPQVLRGCTIRQLKFIKHYIETGNGAKAARLAGYAPNCHVPHNRTP